MSLTEQSIIEISSEGFRYATVISEKQIDFCCQGNRNNRRELAIKKKVVLKPYLRELKAAGETTDRFSDRLQLLGHGICLLPYIEKKPHAMVDSNY